MIDRAALCGLLGTADDKLAELQNEWIDAALASGKAEREPQWSEAVAVGRRSFVERVQDELGTHALHRHIDEAVDGASIRRDPAPAYRPHSKPIMAALSPTSALNSD